MTECIIHNCFLENAKMLRTKRGRRSGTKERERNEPSLVFGERGFFKLFSCYYFLVGM